MKDLKPATEYWIYISALLDDLKGDRSEMVSFTTISCEPETPQPPKFVNRTKTSISLKWNSTADNGSKMLGYCLEYDEGKGEDNFTEIYCDLTRQFKVTKLQASTCYRFRLYAVNEIGKSDYSDIVCYSTSGSVPSQPDAPQLKDAFISKLALVWSRRPSDDDFTLQMEDDLSGHGFLPVYNGRDTMYAMGGLRRNTAYTFKLCAHNEEGQSKWSETVVFKTRPDKPGAPSKPILKDLPKDNGGAEISQYMLELDDGRGFEVIYTGAELEFHCDHLEPGHTYKLCTLCSSAGGYSDCSEVTSITTLAVLPGSCQPPKLQGKPKATSMHLKWSCPSYTGGAAISEYEVCMTMPDNTTRYVYKGYDTDCAVAGLLPGRVYLFQVRAYNKAGAGQWSDPLEAVSGAGPPDRCKEVQVQAKSPHSLFVSWEEPVNNGATITEFRLEWLNQRDCADFVQLYVGAALSYEVKALSPASQYSFRVQAINTAGAGPFSPAASCTTPPSSPAAISSTSIKHVVMATSITLTWRAPSAHGADISSYNIDCNGNLISVFDTDLLEYCVDSLTPETVYRIRVQAVNSVGVGPFSTPLKIQTRSLPPLPPRIECASSSYNNLKLKWGDGKNTDFTQYILEMSGRSGSFAPIYNGTSQTFKVNKLTEQTSYSFRIFAVNDAGNGPYSEEYVFTTSKAPPPALKAPRIWDVSENSCKAEWSVAKPMGDDLLLYQLQLHSSLNDEFRTIYKGSETSYTVEDLEPKTEYRARIGAVRVSSDGSGELIGTYSPITSFTSKSVELVKTASSKTSAMTAVVIERKPLTDKQWASILLLCFIIVGILIAILVQQILSYSRQVVS
ncbi:PREDICTED: fibronectin type-III domain-containing protein 3A-like isoform X2 [Priapulus caudatus]|uniref:Fibronectin type-III domain-containing protein 3A-like isoform X2 n=1 Tax=Priapulus caudatus TaxID=37621 RepID=A0ABM1ENG3_PRICU|nr:PREDICTED: fibronectin type-III domain-containing protein 3A-like isoform X2 [Priapulus caudatus]